MVLAPLCAWSGLLLQGCCWQEVMVVPWLVETVPGSSQSVELVWVEDLCSCTCSGARKGTKPKGFGVFSSPLCTLWVVTAGLPLAGGDGGSVASRGS